MTELKEDNTTTGMSFNPIGKVESEYDISRPH